MQLSCRETKEERTKDEYTKRTVSRVRREDSIRAVVRAKSVEKVPEPV